MHEYVPHEEDQPALPGEVDESDQATCQTSGQSCLNQKCRPPQSAECRQQFDVAGAHPAQRKWDEKNGSTEQPGLAPSQERLGAAESQPDTERRPAAPKVNQLGMR